jgi:ribulose kinase
VAAGLHPALAAAAAAMARSARVREPDPARRAASDRDYHAFLLMHEQRRALDAL